MRGVAAAVAALTLAAPAKAAQPPDRVERALQNAARTYRVPYRELRAVSWCESRWQPWARGGVHMGLFQFNPGTYAATPYAARSPFDPWWNALAAAWLVRRTGGWSHWACRP